VKGAKIERNSELNRDGGCGLRKVGKVEKMVGKAR